MLIKKLREIIHYSGLLNVHLLTGKNISLNEKKDRKENMHLY